MARRPVLGSWKSRPEDSSLDQILNTSAAEAHSNEVWTAALDNFCEFYDFDSCEVDFMDVQITSAGPLGWAASDMLFAAAMKTLRATEAGAEAKAVAKVNADSKPALFVWVKNADHVTTRVDVINNATVKQLMVDVVESSSDMSPSEIIQDLPNLYMATLGGRILPKNRKVMSLIDSGAHLEICRRGQGGMETYDQAEDILEDPQQHLAENDSTYQATCLAKRHHPEVTRLVDLHTPEATRSVDTSKRDFSACSSSSFYIFQIINSVFAGGSWYAAPLQSQDLEIEAEMYHFRCEGPVCHFCGTTLE